MSAKRRKLSEVGKHVQRLMEALNAGDPRRWNRWRDKTYMAQADLFRANLRGRCLSKYDLHNVDLLKANLRGADLSKCIMEFSRMDYVDLRDADARQAGLEHVTLNGSKLAGADLRSAYLNGADLTRVSAEHADLRQANLDRSVLYGANLSHADLREAELTRVVSLGDAGACSFYNARLEGANLSFSDFCGADFRGAKMKEANLEYSSLSGAHLEGADLRNANLLGAVLLDADLSGTNLRGADVSSTVAWGVKFGEDDLKKGHHKSLQIHGLHNPIRDAYEWGPFTIDNIELAHFMALVVQNPKLTSILDAATSKAVLLLGRFTGGRRNVLNRLKEELPEEGYIPIIFDFDAPRSRDTIETVSTLAGLSKFVIADLSDPKSTPLEAHVIIPNISIPFVPIVHKKWEEFSMFRDLRKKYYWVLDTVRYSSANDLIERLPKEILGPAERMFRKISRQRKDLQR